MALAPYFHMVTQRGRGDCTVCCLAMLLGITYEDALEAMSHVATHPHHGMYVSDIQRAAAVLNRPLKIRRKFNPETASGILSIARTRRLSRVWARDHAVILREGIIADPADGMIYLDYETFITDTGAKVGSLLMEDEHGTSRV